MTGGASSQPADLDALIGQLAEDYAQRLRNGEKPEVEEYARQHPAAAYLIRQILPALEILGATPWNNDSSGSTATGTPQRQALGDFEIIREIGRGGMGVVYEAKQLSLCRRVALKVLPFAAVLDERQIQRFRNEALAAAQLDHPHIVNVYGVGCERSVHFYAMRYVEGSSLAEIIAELRRLQEAVDPVTARGRAADVPSAMPAPAASAHSPANALSALSTERSPHSQEFVRSAARVGVEIAEALDHAHQQGVIHRDIKPANIMLDATGKAWVTDFGLARMESSASLTMTGDVLGTLRYMSPEQAVSKRVVVDHRSDIYSLGITLYELLTQRPAFEGDDRPTLLHKIATEEPTPLRRINRAVPDELETILLKAMSKSADDRYGTAQELVDDLQRFLDSKPILARKPTYLQRLAKWTRRNSVAVAVAGLVLLVVAALLGVSSLLLKWQQNEARRHQARAETAAGALAQQQRETQELLAGMRLERGIERLEHDDFRGLWDLAQAHRLSADIPHLQAGLPAVWAGWRQQYVDWLAQVVGHDAAVAQVVFQPGGKLMATASRDQTARLWNVETGLPASPPLPHTAPVTAIAFSNRENYFATGTADGAVLLWSTGGEGAAVVHQIRHGVYIEKIAFSPQGVYLATAARGDASVRLWNVETGQSHGKPIPRVSESTSMAFRSDGRRLAVCGEGDSFHLWDPVQGAPVEPLIRHRSRVEQVAFTPDGGILLTFAQDNVLRLWDAETGELLRSMETDSRLLDLQVSGDGKLAAGGDEDWMAHLWRIADGELVVSTLRHEGRVNALRFTPDSRSLITCSADGGIRIWDTATGESRSPWLWHAGPINSLDVADGGEHFVTASDDGTARLWFTLGSGAYTDIRTFARCRQVAFSSDGDTLAALSGEYLLRWSLSTGHPLGLPIVQQPRLRVFALHPDGLSLATASAGGLVRLWNAESGRFERQLAAHGGAGRAIAFRSDGGALATAASDDPSVRWFALDSSESIPIRVEPSWASVEAVAFSPQGERLVCASTEAHQVQIIDVASRRVMARCELPPDGLNEAALALSRDGKTLAVGGRGGQLWLYETATMEPFLKLPADHSGVAALALHPSGDLVAVCTEGGAVRLIVIRARKAVGEVAMRHPDASCLAFSPDGRLLASGSADGSVRLWGVADTENLSRQQIENETALVLGLQHSESGEQTAVTWSEWRALREERHRGLLNRGDWRAPLPLVGFSNASFRARLTLGEKWAEGLPPAQEDFYRYQQAVAHYHAGLNWAYQDRERDKALADYQYAEGNLAFLARKVPDVPGYPFMLATVLREMGVAHGTEERLDQAIPFFERALRQQKAVENLLPNHAANRDLRSRILLSYGVAYLQSHKPAAGIPLLESAIAGQTKLVQEFPDHYLYRQILAGIYSALGQSHRGRRDHPRAIRAMDQAIALLEPIVEDDLFIRNFANGLAKLYFLQAGYLRIEGQEQRAAEITGRLEALKKRLASEYVD